MECIYGVTIMINDNKHYAAQSKVTKCLTQAKYLNINIKQPECNKLNITGFNYI